MKPAVKWGLFIVVDLLIVLAAAVGIMYFMGNGTVKEAHLVSATLLTEVPSDSATIAEGQHLSMIHGCQDCHGVEYGGQIFADAPPFQVVATNLTGGEGGIGISYTVADWDRAIRYGVKPNGMSTLIMPSKTLHNLSDEDAARIIAYMNTLAPVNNVLPATSVRPLGKILTTIGEFDPAEQVHLSAVRSPAPPADSSAAYGEYLASITCIYCHGAALQGGPPLDPTSPPSPDLRASAALSFASFDASMRTGVTTDGRTMDPQHMPWTAFQHMTAMEMKALYTYIQTL